MLSIGATGTVVGLAYFDQNGNREFDILQDTPLRNVRARLFVRGTRQQVQTVTSGNSGGFRMPGVPVGRYTLTVDTTTIGDSTLVARIDSSEVLLVANDSVGVALAVSFPIVGAGAARQVASGKRIFVEGIALNGSGTYSDTTVHLEDTTGTIRVTGVRSPILAGDRVRVRGIVRRPLGSSTPTVEHVAGFVLSVGTLSQPATITTAGAATANGGLLDAAQVRVLAARITDTATTGAGDRRLTVDDGSGPLEVLIDQKVTISPIILGRFLPDSTVDVAGILVPVAPPPANTWRLKPRVGAEIVLK